MSELYLISTLLMGLLLLAVAVAITREGQRATPGGSGTTGRTSYAEWSNRDSPHGSRLLEIANNPIVWTLSFVLLAIVLLGGAVLFVTDMGDFGGMIQSAVLAIVGALVLGFVFFGTFFSVRDRSGHTAVAIGVSSAVIGVLMLLGIVAALLTA